MNPRHQLEAPDFARLLGNSTEESAILLTQAQYDFRYRRLSREERDHLIIRILDKTVLRGWLFEKYLPDVNAIYEFGCGPAHNLAALARMYPFKELHGLEWVSAPREIIRLLAKKYGYKITGHLFNMFSPDEDLNIIPNSAFLTIGALEQLGTQFGAFLDFALMKKPAIVVHVESLQELYDENNLSDYLASRFVRHRNYLRGFVPRLCELERQNRIEIIKIQKVSCGSISYDGYSYIIWRPRSEGLFCS